MLDGADIELVLNENEIRAVAMSEAGKLVIPATLKILNRARILCPVDTGNLRASLQMKITRSRDVVTGSVFTNVAYAQFVHEGTRPHAIRARPGGVLAFPVPPRSQTIRFAKSVRHPGTRPRPFLKAAIESVAPREGFAEG